MKTGARIIVFIVLFTMLFLALAVEPLADIEIKPQDNHYLNDAKDINYYTLYDEDGKLCCKLVNLYETEAENRSQPVGEYHIAMLAKLNVSRAIASKLTIGEYNDYIYSQPMDEMYIPVMESYGVSPDEYRDFTNMDAENLIYDRSPGNKPQNEAKPPYTDGELDKLNSIGITSDELHSLLNMSYGIEEIVMMTREQVDSIFDR